MSVCLSVSVPSHASKSTRPNITKFSVYITSGRGSILLWRHCYMLCTSSFEADIMLSQLSKWASIEDDAKFRWVRQVAAPVAKPAVLDCVCCFELIASVSHFLDPHHDTAFDPVSVISSCLRHMSICLTLYLYLTSWYSTCPNHPSLPFLITRLTGSSNNSSSFFLWE